MQDVKLYKLILRPKSPLHIGNKEGIYNTSEYVIHSDTLFSGIINCFSMLYGKDETDNLIEDFLNGRIPFKISSVMPYCDGVYYVFKPFSMNLAKKLSTDDYKLIKKVRFIPEDTLLKRHLPIDDFKISGQFLVPIDKDEAKIKQKETARIAVDCITHMTNIFYFSQSVFEENTALWFYLDVSKDFENKIKSSIKLLCDEGIGGDRSVGFGHFDLAIIEIQSINLSAFNDFVSVSLYSPKNDSEIEAIKDYEIVDRAGYLYSVYDRKDIKKKRTKALLEGTTFTKIVGGSIFDVTPNAYDTHKVLRYALSYLLPYMV